MMKKNILILLGIALSIVVSYFGFRWYMTERLNEAPVVETISFSEDEIKEQICNSYKSAFKDFQLVKWDAFSKIGDEYHGIIKFTFTEKGVKLFAVNNFVASEDGLVKEVSYSHSIPYKDLKINP